LAKPANDQLFREQLQQFDRIHGHLLLDAELQNLQEDFGRPH